MIPLSGSKKKVPRKTSQALRNKRVFAKSQRELFLKLLIIQKEANRMEMEVNKCIHSLENDSDISRYLVSYDKLNTHQLQSDKQVNEQATAVQGLNQVASALTPQSILESLRVYTKKGNLILYVDGIRQFQCQYCNGCFATGRKIGGHCSKIHKKIKRE